MIMNTLLSHFVFWYCLPFLYLCIRHLMCLIIAAELQYMYSLSSYNVLQDREWADLQ